MTDENDRKDENQLRLEARLENQLRLEARLEERPGCAEPPLWALAFFVSAMIPGWSEDIMKSNIWPIAIAFKILVGLMFAFPAALIGLGLGQFSSQGWPYRAGLAVLCVGIWACLEYIIYK